MPSPPDDVAGMSGEEERLRVGLLIPSSNSVLEAALWRRFPVWATLHPTRLFVAESSEAGVRGVHDAIPEAARLVATVRPHLILVGCTSVSGVGEGSLEDQLAPAIEATTGAPVLTVLPNVVKAVQDMRCRRLALVTPHGADVDALVIQGLERAGIEVSAIHSMGIRDNFELGRVSPAEIVRFVLDRVPPSVGVHGLFLSCTNFQSVEALPSLRQRYGLRVLSSVGVLVERTLEELARLRSPEAGARSEPGEGGEHGA
jgi:maleate isomerase